jgi:hypothetical protein
MAEDLQLARRKWFKTLKPVLPEEMIGLWRGSEIAADHPLDGVLAISRGSANASNRT